jgi:hypothetical protein
MKRQTLVLLLLTIALTVALFFLFSEFLHTGTPAFAYEIAAAFMGALVTVAITMILLNRQSEVEMQKERNVELLKQKIAVYAGLIEMLNLRLSFVASTDVLKKFNEFARQFSLVAADRKVTDQERAELLDALGELSTTIRHDLSSEEDRRQEKKLFSEEDLKNLVMANVSSLFGKTTPKHFLDACSTEARDYFSRLFAGLDAEGLAYQMGTKGFSASRIFRGYPTFGSKLHGLQLRMDQVAEDKRDEVRELLARLTGRPLASLMGDKTISFTAEELPVEAVCEVVRSVTGDRADGNSAIGTK